MRKRRERATKTRAAHPTGQPRVLRPLRLGDPLKDPPLSPDAALCSPCPDAPRVSGVGVFKKRLSESRSSGATFCKQLTGGASSDLWASLLSFQLVDEEVMVRPEGPPPGLACGGRLGSDGLLSPTWPGRGGRTGSGLTWGHGPLEQNVKPYFLRKYWSPVPFESQKTVCEPCSVDVYWVDSRVHGFQSSPGGSQEGCVLGLGAEEDKV